MEPCDHQSVGVIIINEQDEYLLITRRQPPAGRAPVAGHVDEHGGPYAGALAEVREETGIDLSGVGVVRVVQGSLPNICRRPASHATHDGHYWTIFEAHVDSDVRLKFNPAETRGGSWFSREALQELAERTLLWATGAISDTVFNAYPGLEPVWLTWLAQLGHIAIDPNELQVIRALYSRPPKG